NTVTTYCINKGKGSITIAPLVDKVLNIAEEYSWAIQASHILGISNTILDSLSRQYRCEDYAIKREGLQKPHTRILQSRSLQTYLRRARINNARGIVVSPKTSFLSSEMDSVQNCPRKKVKKERVPIAVLIAPERPNLKWNKDGEKLFRQLLQARGLSSDAADKVISNWSSQWKTHISGLATQAGYLKRIHQQPKYILNLKQLQIFMVKYLEDAINQKCSDNTIQNQRCVLAIFLKFMGYSEQQIHYDLVKQLMREIRMRLRYTDKVKQIWNLDILLNYFKQQIPQLEQNLRSIQQRRAIATTLVMELTVARLAELYRATVLNASDDQYIIQTTNQKSLQRNVEFKIYKIPAERICSLRWFKSWFADRDPDIPNKVQELRRIRYLKNISRLVILASVLP
ncbi:MAG: hypothetical protein EZS28_044011, partial [Streblomastix strix]